MKTITINLPEKYLTAIQVLIESGKYPSKSELVRESIKQCLQVDFGLSRDLEIENLKQMNMGEK